MIQKRACFFIKIKEDKNMNLKLYKQFSDAYQQCIRSAFEDSAIRGEVRTVAKGLPTEGTTILFEREGRYCPVIPVREAF